MASYYKRPETRHFSVAFYPKPGSKLVRASLGTDDPNLAETATRKIELLCELERLAEVSLPEKVLAEFSLGRNPMPQELQCPAGSPPSQVTQQNVIKSPLRNTVKEAIQAYLVRSVASNVHHAQSDKVSRLRQFFGSELIEALDPRPTEIKNRFRKKKLIKPWFTGTTLDEITADLILRFMIEKEYSLTTKRHYRETFHQLFQIALKSGIHQPSNPYNANPADDLPGFTGREGPVTVLAADEVGAQYAAVTRDPLVLFGTRLMIEAGLRLHEALALRRCDLARSGKIRLILPETASGRDTRLKTGERTVTARAPLQSFIVEFLNAADPSDTSWCFQTPSGERLTSDAFGTRLRELNRAAGLAWTSQDYRHTYATQRIAEGWNLKTLAQEMGTSVAMLMSHYAGYIEPPVLAATTSV